MARFRWITFGRALDVLERCCTNAEFIRLFKEFGLNDDLDAAAGYLSLAAVPQCAPGSDIFPPYFLSRYRSVETPAA